MDLSLIICTRDRCHKLARCLEAVRHIHCDRPWELIIVDNGSTDETASVVREFIETVKFPTIYLFEDTPGKSTGLNTAIDSANGRILAFTDDDCYPEPDFLNGIWSAFDDPSVGYIGGRIMLHDPADHPITINESVVPASFPAGSFVCAGSIQGANMAFRRGVLLDIGGFDPLFGPGALLMACEDIDVVGRASAMGWKGKHDPQVMVRHHHGRKAADAAAVWKAYAIGRGAYHMKLLLRGRQFLWFARSIFQLCRRYRTSRGTAFWEMVGAARYSRIYLTESLRGGLHK